MPYCVDYSSIVLEWARPVSIIAAAIFSIYDDTLSLEAYYNVPGTDALFNLVQSYVAYFHCIHDLF